MKDVEKLRALGHLASALKDFSEAVKYNPNHGSDGRFSSGGGSGASMAPDTGTQIGGGGSGEGSGGLPRHVAEIAVGAHMKFGKAEGVASITSDRVTKVTWGSKSRHIADIKERLVALPMTSGGGNVKEVAVAWKDGLKKLKVDPKNFSTQKFSSVDQAKRFVKQKMIDGLVAGKPED